MNIHSMNILLATFVIESISFCFVLGHRQDTFRCRNDQFKCITSDQCVSKILICNHKNDCTDGSDEFESNGCKRIKCSKDEFECESNSQECHPMELVCDMHPDCDDGSDESDARNCNYDQYTTCGSDDYTCDDNACISSDWFCDGEKDCEDGSDESKCPKQCSDDEYTCDNSTKCIERDSLCNGVFDCDDKSDENSLCPPESDTCDVNTEFDCFNDGTDCIDMTKLCDGNDDCMNSADENTTLCKIDYCLKDNGGCHHKCTNSMVGRVCSCQSGYSLNSDIINCEDIDECKIFGSCSQLCENSDGSYECTCAEGYSLKKNNHSCKALVGKPKLIFTNQHEIREFILDSEEYTQVIGNLSFAIATDFIHRHDLVLWADNKKIWSRAFNDGDDNDKFMLVENVEYVNDIAYDWINNNMYWIDKGLNTIEVIRCFANSETINCNYRTTLFSKHVSDPMNIVVDPRSNQGWIYWTGYRTAGEGQIQKAGLDGTRRSILVEAVVQPHGLTIDFPSNRLLWIDAFHNSISSCDFDGSNRQVIVKSTSHIKHPLALTLFEDYIYWSESQSKTILSFKKTSFHRHQFDVVVSGLYNPNGLFVHHKLRQPSGDSPCSSNNGNCSHLCLASPHSDKSDLGYTCLCSEGFSLLNDGRSCSYKSSSTPGYMSGDDEIIEIPVTIEPEDEVSSKSHDQIESHNVDSSVKSNTFDVKLIIFPFIGLIFLLVLALLYVRCYKKRRSMTFNEYYPNPGYDKDSVYLACGMDSLEKKASGDSISDIS